jgi:hypothetical protein
MLNSYFETQEFRKTTPSISVCVRKEITAVSRYLDSVIDQLRPCHYLIAYIQRA